MFQKVQKTVLAVAAVALFASPMAFADADKGQRIFIRSMKAPCGMDGGTMAKKHTQAEWKQFNDDNRINDVLLEYCPDAKPLSDKQVGDVYDFLYHYASDSGNVPAC